MSTNEEYIKKNKVAVVDDDKNTKLHYAAALNNLEEIDKIIASGHKLDPENYLGWTPLMMAIRNGNEKAVELFLDSGADATKKNKFGMNAVLITVTCGVLSIVEKILNYVLCGGVSRLSIQRSFSPVSLAILFGHNHIFKYLLERSFDPNTPTPITGITPLMFAAAIGNSRAMRRLLQHKADIAAKNCAGQSAPEMLRSRHQAPNVNAGHGRPPQPPMMVINHANSPQLQLTPCYYPNDQPNARKSSNAQIPSDLCSPAFSPITPHMAPQVFFGPAFPSTHLVSPAAMFHSNSFLNATISPAAFVSPPQHVCHPGCV